MGRWRVCTESGTVYESVGSGVVFGVGGLRHCRLAVFDGVLSLGELACLPSVDVPVVGLRMFLENKDSFRVSSRVVAFLDDVEV